MVVNWIGSLMKTLGLGNPNSCYDHGVAWKDNTLPFTIPRKCVTCSQMLCYLTLKQTCDIDIAGNCCPWHTWKKKGGGNGLLWAMLLAPIGKPGYLSSHPVLSIVSWCLWKKKLRGCEYPISETCRNLAAPPPVACVVHSHDLVWLVEHLLYSALTSATYIGATYEHSVL